MAGANPDGLKYDYILQANRIQAKGRGPRVQKTRREAMQRQNHDKVDKRTARQPDKPDKTTRFYEVRFDAGGYDSPGAF